MAKTQTRKSQQAGSTSQKSLKPEKKEPTENKSKVVEVTPETPEPPLQTRTVAFFNRSDVVKIENGEKHLVKYLGTERYWSLQQIEICLKDRNVTLVTNGTAVNRASGKFLEFPRKTQIMIRNQERKPCIGCGR
jgi:hypothetical protein